jgi:hypothetical protein
VSPASPAPVACPDQSVRISVGQKPPKTSCLNPTRTIQNGNVRTYRIDALDPDGPLLRADVAGDSILRADLSYAGSGKFSCVREKCGGISMGPYDSQGARSLRFESAKLAAGNETLVVSGTFRTIPDDQLSSTSCTGQLLYINIGAGTVHFCPDGGTGFEIQDDGSTTYRFINGEGKTLAVGVGRQGALQSVEYGAFSCRSPRCAGVRVSPASAEGRRNFIFQGTTLTEQETGVATAILSGNIVLAPQ